ncbi:hypothetical protein EZS27_034351, partial [termite gut metagenome]
SRTAKHISENMDTDPAFYKKFSDLLKETIAAYEQGRIDEVEYLKQVTQQMESVISHTDSDIPAQIADNNTARAYFGLCVETLKSITNYETMFGVSQLRITSKPITDIALEIALETDDIIRQYVLDDEKPIVDWHTKTNLIGKMKNEIEDYLIDEVKRKYEIPLTFDDMDNIIDRSVEVAKLWFK